MMLQISKVIAQAADSLSSTAPATATLEEGTRPPFDNLRDSFSRSTDKATSELSGYTTTVWEMIPSIIISILVLILTYILMRGITNYLNRALDRFSNNIAVNRTLTGFAGIIVAIIGISIALSVLHLDKAVSSVLAGAGLIGLALGFAFQDITVNLISGVIIAFKTPFKINDLVESNGYFGRIKEMNFRSVMLEDRNGQWIILPNRAVLQEPIINYSQLKRRRITIDLGLAYDTNLEEARKVTIKALEELDVVPDQHIEFFYTEFGDSSINASVRYWLNAVQQDDFLHAQSETIIAIQKCYKEHGIEIPFPIRTIISNKT